MEWVRDEPMRLNVSVLMSGRSLRPVLSARRIMVTT
jgi:hypothetical protein